MSAESPQVEDLFEGWFRHLAASLAAPLIDGGRRKAEVDRAQAVLDGALSAYRQTILSAFREVEDALVRERRTREGLEALANQHAEAELTLEEARRRYEKGLSDYLPVLTALRSVQQLERELLHLRTALFTNRVVLHRALGGTWAGSVVPAGEDE